MKKNIVALAVLAGACSAWAQTYVAPHVTRNGTYVEGHVKTNPNSTVDDNYSTRGNVNPYTGEQGTKPRSSEYTPPPTYTPPKSTYGSNCGYTAAGQYVCR